MLFQERYELALLNAVRGVQLSFLDLRQKLLHRELLGWNLPIKQDEWGEGSGNDV